MSNLSRLFGCGLILVAVTGHAEFEPTISAGISHTDNVNLSAVDTQRESVFQVLPAFEWTRDSTRLDADVAYRLEAYYYDEADDSEIYNLLDSELEIGLVPDRFLLDIGASRSQTVRDPQSTVPLGNLAISANRVDRDDYFVGPVLRLPLGGSAVLSGDFRRTWTRFEEDASSSTDLVDYDNDTVEFAVDNYARGAGLTWAVRYYSERSEYEEEFVPYEYGRAMGELGFWASEATRVFLGGGKESPWDEPFNPDLEDSFWEVGFAQDLGERLSAEFAVGERTFGSTGRGTLNYALTRGSMLLTYLEAPTSTASNRYSRDGLLDEDQPPDYLFTPDGIERYILKRSDWRASFELSRTAFSISLYDESRVDRTLSDGTPLADQFQNGAIISVSWRAGAKTELSLRGSKSHQEFASGEERDLTTGSIAADYRLGARTHLALTYEQWREDSNTTSASVTPNYVAKIVSVILSRTF